MGLFSKIFGTHSDHELKRIQPLVDRIEALSDTFAAMSEEELKGQTAIFRERLKNGETVDDLLPEAFAAVREASWRVLGKKHYRVQLIGGIVLHQGRIAEMKTGEGKTLVATLPAYLNALSGNGVHIVTVNDYLAKRDSEWMGKIYNYMGLSVGLIIHEKTPAERRESYAADITYGTNNEFGFDYLRDNMVNYKKNLVQREHAFAIVDEIDSILIDEARTPLIISGRGDLPTPLYGQCNAFARTLKMKKIKETDNRSYEDANDCDYLVDEKARSVSLTPSGVAKAERYFAIENLTAPENNTLLHHINQAIRALGIMKRDEDYAVVDGKVIIVDTNTGRLMYGRRYNDGLHQAIEAKEGVEIEKENKTLATITIQNYFRLYRKLSGMTGTALTEEEEFREIYNLDVVEIPTNKPMIRTDYPDIVYKTREIKYNAIIDKIVECHEKGQPVLVGTVSIEKSEHLSEMLTKRGVAHNVLNAKVHAREAEIVAQAGKFGAVTISTNMAGRGTDIMLGGNPEFMAKAQLAREGYDEDLIRLCDSYFDTDDEAILDIRKRFAELDRKYREEIADEVQKVKDAGGLFIIGSERHESRRIDNQLRGRSGRQGDPGASMFFLSFEDDLLRLFAGNRLLRIANTMPQSDEIVINMKLISKVIESAQKNIESRNFSRRKNVLMYDDVMNQQRTIIYRQRRDVLDGKDIQDNIRTMLESWVESTVSEACAADSPEDWNFDIIREQFNGLFTTDADFCYTATDFDTLTPEDVGDLILKRARARYAAQEALFGSDVFREVERSALLFNVDSKWMDHIDEMSDLMSSIGLQAVAQRSPIVEYKIVSADMFDEMVAAIKIDTVRHVMTAQPKEEPIERKRVVKITGESQGDLTEKKPPKKTPTVAGKKVGPNDPCPCGSGKKYKKCCG